MNKFLLCLCFFSSTLLFAESEKTPIILSKEILRDKDDLISILSKISEQKRDTQGIEQRIRQKVERNEEVTKEEKLALGEAQTQEILLHKSKTDKLANIVKSYPREEVELLIEELKDIEAYQQSIRSIQRRLFEIGSRKNEKTLPADEFTSLASYELRLKTTMNHRLVAATELGGIVREAKTQELYNQLTEASIDEREKILNGFKASATKTTSHIKSAPAKANKRTR